MPSSSEPQRKFFAADLARKREGKETQSGMDEEGLRDYARKPVRGHKRSKRHTARGSRRK
jgi:hypothetical protein